MGATLLPRACVIGAGSSGLVALKALLDRGIPADCFELGDDVGGVWYYQNTSGLSACYKHLHINTSRCRMELEDFPMPSDWPNFCRHDYVHRYFQDYATRFGLREHITFNTGVTHAARRDDGVWEVGLSTGETREYDVLLVCNGHHWDPRWPEPPFPGAFDGVEMHSHDYCQPEDFAGKRVVVVGMGNSAMDIAVELSYTAEKVFLSHRRGSYIVPKYLFGRPLDLWVRPGVPPWLGQLALSFMLWVQVGRVENYGLKRPTHKLMQAHPTISSTILDRIAHGDVHPRGNIVELRGGQVCFEDGVTEDADVIIYCTGYKVSFPFFEPEFLSAPDNDLPLYKRMFKPDLPNVIFIGLYQPLGAIFPLAERQARIAAAYITGDYAAPTPAEMERAMDTERDRMFRRYVKSKRHTMQVDYDAFMAELKREYAQGQARARRAGARQLPVRALAQAPDPVPSA